MPVQDDARENQMVQLFNLPFEKITEEHASRLRELVRGHLRKASATEQAKA